MDEKKHLIAKLSFNELSQGMRYLQEGLEKAVDKAYPDKQSLENKAYKRFKQQRKKRGYI